MKLDQETIVKQQFWFLLGGYFFIWLIAVMWMKFTYPETIEAPKKEYEAKAGGVKTAMSSPVNTATFLPPWENEAKEFSGHKGKIWKAAWEYQSGMYDWPEKWVKKYDMTSFQAPISADDLNEYKDKLYPDQIKYWSTYAPKLISPVELKDSFDNVFSPKTDWKETPTREEVWLAQEDFWVKRELFFVIYDAMARQAQMLPVPDEEIKEPMPKGVAARYRYRNKNWEITLHIRKNDKGDFVIGGDSTIKNIHPTRHPQPLTSAKGKGIWFNVAQDNVHTLFEVRGEAVVWNETKKFSDENYPEPLSGIKWDKEWVKEHPILVSQGFDQTNCPIRRLNAIEVPKRDSRTFIWPLQPNHILVALDPGPEEGKAGDGIGAPPGGGGPGGMAMPGAGPPGGPPGAGPPGGPGMMPGMPGGTTAPAGNPTPNNAIERNRYLQSPEMDKKFNPPSRHLPLAFQLIVEQTHMHDVLLSLANSRLRFQITQVEFRHFPDYTPQSEDDKDKKDSVDMAGPRVFMGGMPPPTAGGAMEQQMRQRQIQMQREMQQRMQQQQAQQDTQRQIQMQMQRQMQMMMMRQGGPGGMGAGPPSRPPSVAYAPGSRQPGGPTTPTVAGTTNDTKQTAANQTDDNLVELTVYGIATLYRAPDVPSSPEQTGQPGAPPPQAGQQPAASAAPPAASAEQPQTATSPASPQTPAPSGSPPAATKQSDKPDEKQKPDDKQKAPPPAPRRPETKKVEQP